mmetsp:Transcript_5225/g.4411  ORF Transcript_5225/g.4411 Transcript_5225/m.4411 type:complete len:146 (+) Transcript_5225:248-685(+)
MNEAKLLCPLDVDKCGYQIKWFHLGSNQINFSPSRSLTHQEVCWYKVDLKGVKFDKLEIKIKDQLDGYIEIYTEHSNNYLTYKTSLSEGQTTTLEVDYSYDKAVYILVQTIIPDFNYYEIEVNGIDNSFSKLIIVLIVISSVFSI